MGCTQHHRTCYTRVRKGYYHKGFRLNSRRFSVHRLRAKFLHLLRLLSRLKSLYARAIRGLMKKSTTCVSRVEQGQAVRKMNYALYGSFSSSNSSSFYAEAIADCLDFIHRNSLSMEEKEALMMRQG